MKDLFLRLILVITILIFESVVGLPVLGFSLFLGWYKKSLHIYIIWLVLISLSVSILWGMSWWLVAAILLCLTFLYEQLSKKVLNKLVKMVSLVLPASLVMAIFLNIDFYWRVVAYGLLSFIVLFVFQKYILTNYEKKYL